MSSCRATNANPQPAASQVWLVEWPGQKAQVITLRGPVGTKGTAWTSDEHPGGVIENGTLTDGKYGVRARCVGVATPHGRVMVGDGFALSDGHRVAVIEVAHHGVVECSHSGGGPSRLDADRLALEATRTRYAPARVGERYIHRLHKAIVAIPDVPRMMSIGVMGDEVRVHLCAGVSMPVDAWERLGPSTVSHAVAPVPQVAESDAALRERIVAAHRAGIVHSAVALRLAAEEIAAASFGGMSPHEIHVALRTVCDARPDAWTSFAAVWAPAFRDCNPLTATGAALDRLTPLWGVERRKGPVASACEVDARVKLALSAVTSPKPSTIRFNEGARASGVAAIRFNGEEISVPVCIGDTAAVISANLQTAINARAASFTATRLANPGGIPTASPEPADEERTATAIADRRALDLGVPRREGEPVAAFTRRCNAIEVRRAIDKAIAADHGPFATARAAALHAWAETLYSHDTVADVAAVHAGLLRYEACRGSRREPSLAAMDVGVPETARAMYERERAAVRVETVTPQEEPARPTGGASPNGWQSAAHFWERWTR